MLTAYLVIGLLNIFTQNNSYGINSDSEIRVRQDVPYEYMLNIYTESSTKYDREGGRLKRESTQQQQNAAANRNWRNNYVWNKIKQQKHDNNPNPGSNMTASNSTTGNRRYPSHHTLMPRYNNTGFQSGTLYPGSDFNSTVYNTGSSNYQPEVQVATNTSSNVTPVDSNGTSTADSITPVMPGEGSKTKVKACVICSIPCPAGRHREGVYCVKDNLEYE